MSDTAPRIARNRLFAVDVEAGKTDRWCAWGQSSQQPFCDGSHRQR